MCALAISFAQLWVFLVLEWQRKQQVPTTSVLPCSRDHVGSSLWHGHWHVERRPVYSVFPQCPAAECSGNSNLQLLSILASIQYFDLSWCNFLTFVLSCFRHHCLRVVNGENPLHWKNQQPDGEGLGSCVFSELFYSEAFPEPCLPRWARWSRWSVNSLTECGKWVNLPGLVEFFGWFRCLTRVIHRTETKIQSCTSVEMCCRKHFNEIGDFMSQAGFCQPVRRRFNLVRPHYQRPMQSLP